MAHDEKLLSKDALYSEQAFVDFRKTMFHMELIFDESSLSQNTIDKKSFRENFESSVVIESPDEKNSANVSFSSEYSLPLSSTLRFDDDEWRQNEVSVHSGSFSDSSDPSTSTPQRRMQTTVRKYKVKRPPNLIIHEASDEEDYNHANVSVNQCSPVRSPFPGLDDTLDLDNSCVDLDETIEPQQYDTPPVGVELDKRERKMVYLLKRYGLTHFAFIFIEQEVDLDLFLTLSDSDLQEIGIGRKRDRTLLLSIIEECNCRN